MAGLLPLLLVRHPLHCYCTAWCRVWREHGSAEWQETLVVTPGAGSAVKGAEWADKQHPRQHHPQQQQQQRRQQQPLEVLQPVSDPLIRRCLQVLEAVAPDGSDSSDGGPLLGPSTSGGSASDGGAGGSSFGRGLGLAVARAWQRLAGQAMGERGEVRWLPTSCLQLLNTLAQVRRRGGPMWAGGRRITTVTCTADCTAPWSSPPPARPAPP